MDMPDDKDKERSDDTPPGKTRARDFGQIVLGEIETIGGVLSGDPLTQAEGEFNVEVGSVREEIDEELDEAEVKRSE